MNTFAFRISVFLVLTSQCILAQEKADYVSAFKDTLSALSNRSEDEFFNLHCQSIIDVIDAQSSLSSADTGWIQAAYDAFNANESLKDPASYRDRNYPYILAWESPADGVTSLSLFSLPKDYDPEEKYPLYIQLHGNWHVADNIIDYMTYPYQQNPGSSFAFEDGFHLSPWGRGNQLMYREISETDIWECMDALNQLAGIDPNRRYLCGHSNGGNGTAYIAYRSPSKWAALGLYGAALTNDLFDFSVCVQLKDIPIYFVYGEDDTFKESGQIFYTALFQAGNRTLEFVTVEGDHEYRQEDVEDMYLWMKQYSIPTFVQEPSVISEGFVTYPNPFYNELLIDMDCPSSGSLSIKLINSQGQMIRQWHREVAQSGRHSITLTNLQSLPPGPYFLSIHDRGKRAGSMHLIKIQ